MRPRTRCLRLDPEKKHDIILPIKNGILYILPPVLSGMIPSTKNQYKKIFPDNNKLPGFYFAGLPAGKFSNDNLTIWFGLFFKDSMVASICALRSINIALFLASKLFIAGNFTVIGLT